MPFIGRRQALAALALAPLASRVVRAAEPKRLIGVIEEDPPFFNLAMSSGISSFVSSAPCYSALLRMAVAGEMSPDLAESYEISPDGMTYTFKLRKNVEWHDGHPFSSEDVKFSLEQVNSKLHPYHGAMNAIDKFEAPDPNTFVLRLKHPQVSLIYSLSNFSGAILPKHIWEEKRSRAIRTIASRSAPVPTSSWNTSRATTSSTRRMRSTSCRASPRSTS